MWRSKVLEGGNGMPGREEEEGACLTDARVKNGDRYRLYIQVITSVQRPDIFSKKRIESKRRRLMLVPAANFMLKNKKTKNKKNV